MATQLSKSSRGPWLAILILLALATGVPSGAQKPQAPSGGSSEISVTLVEIPVEVVRNGEPVKGLTAADFEVVEGRRSLPIVAFETIDLEAPIKPQSRPSSPAARRHLLMLFDFAFTHPHRLEEGVAAARELVAKGLDPRDFVAVGIYLPKGELTLLLSFTTDRAAATRTLSSLEAMLKGESPAKGTQESDPLRLTGLGTDLLLSQVFRVDERNFAADALASLGAPDGTWGGFLQMNVLSHSSVLHRPNVESAMRGHVLAMAGAMEGLADTLRPVTGRKYLTLFSEGFPLSMVGSVSSPRADNPGGTGGSQLYAKLEKTLGELRRSGWILHAVALGGTKHGSLDSDGLFHLANETGGVLVEGTNKLADGLEDAFDRSAHGYVLTVELDDLALDGAFHKADVRLRGNARRARVNHRGGYFAPLPFSQQKGIQRLADAATLMAGADERDDLGIDVVAVPMHSGPESSTVAVLVEVPGPRLLTSGAPRMGLEIFGYALDQAGNSSDFFAQAVDLDPAKVGSRLAEGGVRVLGKLDIPPGEHRLRVMVRDRVNGRVSLLTVPLSLSSTAADPSARLDAVFLPPPQDPWLLVRPSETSFDLHGRAVLPAAHGVLPAAGEVQVLLMGQGFTDKGAKVRGRILTAEGKAATTGTLEFLSVTPGEAGQPDLLVGRLQAGALPPGHYLLELRLEGETGKLQAMTARPFQVAAVGKP